jgi:histidyl-tRNA synthetase
MLAKSLLQKLGIKSLELKLNSIGCPKCRPVHNEKLKEYLVSNVDNMCGTCKDRFERNPLRILDCKVEGCKEIVQGAPRTVDYLCDECKEHFEVLKSTLESLDMSFTIDPLLVRGLDYYSKTVFEFVTDTIGSQGTVCGGGRYDNLIEEIGGKPMSGIGFGMGMERLLMTMDSAGIEIPKAPDIDIYIATATDSAKSYAINLAKKVRDNGLIAEVDFMNRSLKAQMKYADKINCRYVAIIGDDEIETGLLKIRSMEDGDQQEIKIDNIVKYIER